MPARLESIVLSEQDETCDDDIVQQLEEKLGGPLAEDERQYLLTGEQIKVATLDHAC